MRADSATALAQLGDPKAADAALAGSRELWQATPAVSDGDLDKVAALLELRRGRLDAAQAFAAASVRLWKDRGSRRGRTGTGIVLATIHIQQLLATSAARTALVYRVSTLLAALAAVYAKITITRWAVHCIHHHREAR